MSVYENKWYFSHSACIEGILRLLHPQGAYILGKKMVGSVSLENSSVKIVNMRDS